MKPHTIKSDSTGTTDNVAAWRAKMQLHLAGVTRRQYHVKLEKP